MLYRLIALSLCFTLSAVNFIFLLLPVLIVIGILASISPDLATALAPDILWFLLSLVSAFMIVAFLLDWLFGFSVYRMTRKATLYTKLTHQGYYTDLNDAFSFTKEKFNMPKVRLYIDSTTPQSNAFAIGSFRKKAIVITQVLLAEIYNKAQHKEDPYDAMRGILGHEMSHLINSDFLPGMIIATNQSVTDKLSRVVKCFFWALTRFVRWIPLFGELITRVVMATYRVINFCLSGVQTLFVLPCYGLLQKWLSRNVEYRCDRQSAKAFGGPVMAKGLQVLGEGSYFSIFSTHPRTKTRIAKIQDIKALHTGSILPEQSTYLANFIGVVLIVWVCHFAWQKTDIVALEGNYRYHIKMPIEEKVEVLKGHYYQWRN